MSDQFRFKKGDRVYLARSIFLGVASDKYDADIGQVGTVMEEDNLPWIEFDLPTRYPYQVMFEVGGLPTGKAGHLECCSENDLEPAPQGAFGKIEVANDERV